MELQQLVSARKLRRPNGKRDYLVAAAAPVHWRSANCEEVDCGHWRNGWRIRVEGLPAELLHTARTSGRKFTELHIGEHENYLVFEAGQRCFHPHQVRTDVPEFYLVDNNGSVRVHQRAEDWAEDAGEHTGKIVDQIKKG